jgi:ribosome-binding protein aMBF1 (putative translation factor)
MAHPKNYQGGFIHQDLTPCVITKKHTSKEIKEKHGVVVPKSTSSNTAISSSDKSMSFKAAEADSISSLVTTKSVGDQIRTARLARGWKQTDLARYASVKPDIIQKAENPTDTTIITQTDLQKIARALGINIVKDKKPKTIKK